MTARAKLSLATRGSLALIAAYKKGVSPVLGAMGCNCRFHPTCSEYARQAFASHGFVKGLTLTAYRLLRCQPLCKGGIDPVPKP